MDYLLHLEWNTRCICARRRVKDGIAMIKISTTEMNIFLKAIPFDHKIQILYK